MDNEQYSRFQSNYSKFANDADERRLRYVYKKFKQFEAEEIAANNIRIIQTNTILNNLKDYIGNPCQNSVYNKMVNSILNALTVATPAEICSLKMENATKLFYYSMLFGLGFFNVHLFMMKKFVYALISLIIKLVALIIAIVFFLCGYIMYGVIIILILFSYSIISAGWSNEIMLRKNRNIMINHCEKLIAQRSQQRILK